MAVNLALGATPSASSQYSTYHTDHGNDGDEASQWISAAVNAWWKVDLGSEKLVDKISIKTGTVSYSFVVAGSNNNTDWTTIFTAGAAVRNTLVDFNFNAVSYRYFRISYTDGANWSTLFEMQVWSAEPPATGRYLGSRGRDRTGFGGSREPRRDMLIDSSRKVTASGGAITEFSTFAYHTFTGDGVLTVVGPGAVDILVVGGGGGGGCFRAGGGGGGGSLYVTGKTLQAGVYKVVIGNGGAGSNVDADQGGDGQDTVFDTLTVKGGGGGGTRNDAIPTRQTGRDGGCGGGGAASPTTHPPGGSGVSGQGYNGGAGDQIGSFNAAGGGGGAGQVGSDGSVSTGGKGGDGLASSITGTSVTYGGGGGGCGDQVQGNGGAGGGGRGAIYNSDSAVAGTANTGGGGGGGLAATKGGKNGGSGIVIVRYSR